jgi:uncharacterized protein (TIGR02145 family)
MKSRTWKYPFLISMIVILISVCKKENDLTDLDDTVYHSVTIGTQTWMVENLKVTHYRNGDPIQNVTDETEWDTLTTGAYCNYNNDNNFVKPYGRLYNWHAVNDIRNLAPEGWHIATEAEIRELIAYVGAEDVAGGRLKESGTAHWKSPNTNATNQFGFTALPGGTFTGLGFALLGESGNLWSSTEFPAEYAYYLCLSNSTGRAFVSFQDKTIGCAVRCIKDHQN